MTRFGQVLAAALIGMSGAAFAAEPTIKDQGDRYSGAAQATRAVRHRMRCDGRQPFSCETGA